MWIGEQVREGGSGIMLWEYTKDTTKLRLSTWNISFGTCISCLPRDVATGVCTQQQETSIFQPLSVRECGVNTKFESLKVLITTEQTENMPSPTGIPTHIDLQSMMEEILIGNNKFLEKLELQSTIIQEAVKKAIQENDVSSGTVTMPILAEQLDNHHKSIIDFIKANCAKLSDDCRIDIDDDNETDSGISELLYVKEFQKGTEKCPMYCYDGQFWDVPKNWEFQKNPTRKVGWEYWIKGKQNNEMLVNNVVKKAPLKPYRFFIRNKIPKNQRNVLSSTWNPIFTYMEDTPNINIPNNPEEITATVIDRTFEEATEHMKRNLSYIWNLKNSTIQNWSICTWSKYVSHGYVEKQGTESDKIDHRAYRTFRCLPRKKNREALPSLIGSPNNHDTATQSNNNNPNKTKTYIGRANTSDTRRRRLTFDADGENEAEGENEQAEGENDIFGAAFAPDPVYMEAARIINDVNGNIESTNEQNELEKQQNEQSEVEVHTDLGTNMSNTTTTAAVVNHSAAWASTILEAAGGIDGDSNDE